MAPDTACGEKDAMKLTSIAAVSILTFAGLGAAVTTSTTSAAAAVSAGQSTGQSAGAARTATALGTPGSQLWVSSYKDSAADGTHERVAVSPDGSTVYASGGSAETVKAYSAVTGATLWTATNPASESSFGLIAVSPDGTTVYVTTAQHETDGYETVAYDAATGTALWSDDLTNGVYAFPGAIAVSPDSTRVYVTGWMEAADGHSSYATVAYTSTGTRLWVKNFLGPRKRSDFTTLAVSPNGTKVFVTGTTVGPRSRAEYATVAYFTQTGSEAWVSYYRAAAGSSPTAITTSPDGTKVYVTGTANQNHQPLYFDSVTVAYAASTGAQLWLARIPGQFPHENGTAAVAASPDGSKVYVTGLIRTRAGGFAYLTQAYLAKDGSVRWRAVYSAAPGTDEADAIAVSPDGSTVYVTGETQVTSSNFATVAYQAGDGTMLWAASHRGTKGTALVGARSLAVSPDGLTVFITGFANSHIVTVAYQG
jgi:DNA-binding beta-propeller fold protein YncE